MNDDLESEDEAWVVAEYSCSKKEILLQSVD